MAIIASGLRRAGVDHFEPQDDIDPQAQRRLRGRLEQIDYTAFAANREVVGKTVGPLGIEKFQRLSIAVARARANWIDQALQITSRSDDVPPEDIARLEVLRRAYQELSEAYEAMRRVVERGYCAGEVSAP